MPDDLATRKAAVSLDRIEHARGQIADIARRTPVITSATLSDRMDVPVVLKAENLQRVGSFKVRGALAKLAALGDSAAGGVVCASAGNHAQAVALAARERGVRCDVVMPVGAPVAKAEATESLGANVLLEGETVLDCVARAREIAETEQLLFVHPFDDPDVICGQGTLGLELLEQVPEMSAVLVPVGGGGLVAGVGTAIKALSPNTRVIGVQASVMAAFGTSLAGGSPNTVRPVPTIADGIAVSEPSELTLALAADCVDEMLTVTEDEIAEAMVILMEKTKLVVEGAGAAGAAALLSGAFTPHDKGPVCVVLSGGNVDPGLLSALARRNESQAGRRHVLFTKIADRPGSLAAVLDLIAAESAGVVDVTHIREGLGLHVAETGLQFVIETRSAEHGARVVNALRSAGYEVSLGVGDAASAMTS